MLQKRSGIKYLERLHKRLGRKLPCKMRDILEIGALVALASDLDDLILTLRGKGLQAVINGNVVETNQTGSRQKEKIMEENQRCLI